MDKITVSFAREARGGFGRTKPVATIRRDGGLIIIDDSGASVIKGELEQWLSAHLAPMGMAEATVTLDGANALLTTERGTFTLPAALIGAAAPPAPTPDSPAAIPVEAKVPEPDLPPITPPGGAAPGTVHPGDSARGPFRAPTPGETIAAYAADVLEPQKATVEEALATGALQEALRDYFKQNDTAPDESWDPIITLIAAPALSNPGSGRDTGARLRTPTGEIISIIAKEGEDDATAVTRVSGNHPEAKRIR